ncbi:MAG: ribonuclease H-like YkuK family protein [Candidatus Saccharibacteria bacterium]
METHDSINFSDFHSPTYGQMDITEVVQKILTYVGEVEGAEYELIIGSDSTLGPNHNADFVSAIVVHRKRSGGIYFWTKRREGHIHSLRQRIFQEALDSLKVAEQLLLRLKEREVTDFRLSIHVDVGPNGETKKMLHEIVGMVKGSGYDVKTKPDSFGASSVADRHT